MSVACGRLGGMRHVFEEASGHGVVGVGRTVGEGGMLRAADLAVSLVRSPPDPALAMLVERHWLVRWEVPPGQEHTQSVLPHASTNLVAESDGAFAVHGIPRARFDRHLTGSGAAF